MMAHELSFVRVRLRTLFCARLSQHAKGWICQG